MLLGIPTVGALGRCLSSISSNPCTSTWGTSPIRNRLLVGSHISPAPRVLVGSWGGGLFLMGEAPL